jgi:adenylosuccinate lyase
MLKKSLNEVMIPSMEKIIAKIEGLAEKYAALPMLARTHGQTATPTTLGKEMINFSARLQTQLSNLKAIKILGKINGAVGNFNAHLVAYPKMDWLKFSKQFVENLGLHWNAHTTQIEPHDFIAEIMDALSRFNTILIDFNRDIWGYISLGYFQQQKIESEVGSSTMPHKINPIDFENSEGNLGLSNAISRHLAEKLPISRWQRDLSDSTVLRNLGLSFGYAFLAYLSTSKGLDKLSANEALIRQDLNDHWEVLTEALQTVMRRFGMPDAYEQLKALSRGKPITQNVLLEFVDQLALPEEVKKSLRELRPDNYIGFAEKLTQSQAEDI